eukprot:scaffold4574_cov143-Isochrysis_galbana.AAC.4
MGPREDIFSTSGAPESRMNTTSTSAAKASKRKRQGREQRPLNERPVLVFSLEDLREENLSSQYLPSWDLPPLVPQTDVLVCPEAVCHAASIARAVASLAEKGGLPVSPPPTLREGLRVGGRGRYLTFVFHNIAQVRLDHSLSCLGQVPTRFANALRGEIEPVRLPPQARQGVRSREKFSFVELGADRNRAIPRADPPSSS